MTQERIRLSARPDEQHRPPAREEKDDSRNLASCSGAGARSAARYRVLAGIEQLLRSAATAA